MGKIYAIVTKVTPLETRNKKDNSGTYEYADLDLQPYDASNQPMSHQTWDWQTGQPREPQADIIRYDCIRDKAKELQQQNYQVGEVVLLDISIAPNRYGHTEITVMNVQRVQQQTQQPLQQYQPGPTTPYGQYR